MITYLDQAATSMPKPLPVSQAVLQALEQGANPGRSAHDGAMYAARTIYQARRQIAALADWSGPENVAFTSGATESLNLLIQTLVEPKHHVITTVLEHNAVLRPLYRTGCALSYINCDDQGRLQWDQLENSLRANTRFLLATHGSNVLGSITDLALLQDFCQRHQLIFILDAAQTFGSIPLSLTGADYICFTGHKGLLGPQGTGGVLSQRAPMPEPRVFKTGGTGYNSFAKEQPCIMPDLLEAGTPNTPGISGLGAGAAYLLKVGLAAVMQKERQLTRVLLDGLSQIPTVRVYGPQHEERLPLVALNVGTMDSEDVSLRLWEEYQIATRPGSHCAPLVHQRFGTQKQGMVRFSFNFLNTEQEIIHALQALEHIAKRQ